MIKQILNRLPRKPSKSGDNRDGGTSAFQSNASNSSRSSDLSNSRPGNLSAPSLSGVTGSSAPGLNHGDRLPQAINAKVNGHAAVFSVEALPNLKDVPPSEKQNLFIKKLNLCCVLFDFSDPTKNTKEKEIKRQTLVELVDYVTSALLSFTYLSLKSFHSPNSPSSETPSLIVQSSQVVREEEEVLSDVYNSPGVFRLNYEEMERKFKVYIYKDGDPKTFYQTPRKLTGKYSSEGYFFQNIRESKFVTEDPNEAHLFFIPISCHKMRGKGTSYENMTIIVQNYVDSLIAKYPYWNRTMGADHFFVTCHDVGVRATEGHPFLVKNAIRVVCSPSYDVGYIPHKDVALPQVLQPFALPAGGNDIENRTTLGFWAGHRNSKIRVILARQWENDTELDISNNRINRATGPLVYQKRFYRTKFCICPGGSQVNSARITDSIHYGCVPVILSDYYDLPFNDIIDWRKFAVVLREKDVYDLKQILKNITQEEFVTLHNNLVKVQKHFQWNSPPIRHDAFHMVMYELCFAIM